MSVSDRKIGAVLAVSLLFGTGLGCAPPPPPPVSAERVEFFQRLPELEEALDANPNNEETLHMLASGYWWLASDVEQSQIYYERLLALNPEFLQGHFELAQVLNMRGRYAESISHNRRFLELYSVDSEPGPSVKKRLAWFENLSSKDTAQDAWTAEERSATNSLDMEFVRIPGGEFVMGNSEGGRDSAIEHNVTLDGYWISTFEVTAGQFEMFLNETEYKKRFGAINDYARSKEHAVVQVTWNDAVAFTVWLSSREGRVYRLPSEAEWEFAARGNDGRTNPWGNEKAKAQHHGNLDRFARAVQMGKAATVEKVGQYEAGKSFFGLHDMAGNAEEWCLDYYDEIFYRDSPAKNPFGPSNPRETNRVQRGGSWRSDPSAQHAVMRSSWDASTDYDIFGFRVVCEVETGEE